MTAVSIVSIILLAMLVLIFALALKKQEARIGLRCAAACGQLLIVMTVALFVFLLAQDSVIYNNATTGLYDAEKIDLFYMSKASGVMSLIAFVWAGLCFAGSLLKQKRVWIFILGTLAVIGGIALALYLLTAYCPTDYYATIVPAVLAQGWCMLVLTVNALLDSQRLWRKLTLIAFNIINAAAAITAIISTALLANSVAQSIEVKNVMVALFAFGLIIAALPALINGVLAVSDSVKIIKNLKGKA